MSISMGKRDICLIIAIRGSRLSRTHRRCSYSITSISIPCKVRPTRSRRTVSYKAYQLRYDPFDICDAAPMLDIVGGSRCYCKHLEKVAGRIWSVEVLPRRRIPDEEALSVAHEVLPSIDPALLKALPRLERDACLLRLRRAHLTVKQIARITGIGATSVTKATAGWKEAA